ncbi:hypothetical protein ACQP3C_24535 [Escherichia coli]
MVSLIPGCGSPSTKVPLRGSFSNFLHNSKSLSKKFGLTRETAGQIIKQCGICPQYGYG